MRALLLLGLVACGRATDECRIEAERLTALLREAPHGRSIAPEPGIVLPRRLVQRLPAPGSMLLVGNARTLTHHGQPLARYHVTDVMIEQHDRGARTVYFQLDRGTPWSTVVELVDDAKLAGFTRVGFAFETGEPVPARPPRSPIDDKLDALEARAPADRAPELARLFEGLVEDCPAFGRSRGHDLDESPSETLLQSITPALIECGCKVDLPQLRSMLWRLLVLERPIGALELDPTGGEPLVLPGATSWEEASKQLAPDARRQLVAR